MYKARTLKQDLDNPKIARGTGRVRQRWSNYYTAEVDNIRLNDPSYVFDLPPGQYTFYYLPKSRKLLSATPLAPNNHETHLKLFAQDLQKKFHFNDQDLAINHNNQLSTKQKLLMLIPITGYTVGIILILIISVASIANPPNESYIGILIFSLFMLLIIWVLFDDLQKLVTDWYTGTVLSIVGPLKTRTKGGVRHRTYYFVIDDKEFEVSATKFGMAIKGINYRIYYTPYAHRLVAIEPLSIIP
ncbi:MAG TPA: hypothetical protein VLL52_08895 [Anaerolineae bacterium]|nr:hypothetical protein [Anaerolineae bacterium]